MSTETLHERVPAKLCTVIDPETGADVVRMWLIENLQVDEENGMVRYIFRPSSPFCPLAVALGLAIPEAVPQVEDVARQEIEVQGYVGAQALNELLRERRQGGGIEAGEMGLVLHRGQRHTGGAQPGYCCGIRQPSRGGRNGAQSGGRDERCSRAVGLEALHTQE